MIPCPRLAARRFMLSNTPRASVCLNRLRSQCARPPESRWIASATKALPGVLKHGSSSSYYIPDAEASQPKKLAEPKRKQKPSLRRAAFEATRRSESANRASTARQENAEKTVTAFCSAQEYDMMAVARILRFEGVPIDPTGTSLYPEVIHLEMPANSSRDIFGASLERSFETGDVFIFPSGSIVAWNVPDESIKALIGMHLKPAARGSHDLEIESIEYREDSSKERSSLKAGVILLGTSGGGAEAHVGTFGAVPTENGTASSQPAPNRHASTVLAQVAFSSGLAKSTKIAVLENQLDDYLEDTQDIPKTLISGHLGSVTRPFIYQKMGQLLTMRGQLNLSSDLTDAVPDLLWDTEPELGLEAYHERVSRELDIGVRIERLNQRLDYAHEIASILREELSAIREEDGERKSTRLEWIIIALIAVEVGFGCWNLYKDYESHGISKVQVVA